MLTTLKNAFKIKEIRQKILFTLGMLVVIRIGSQLPNGLPSRQAVRSVSLMPLRAVLS
mgnify:CR=1 FL=1